MLKGKVTAGAMVIALAASPALAFAQQASNPKSGSENAAQAKKVPPITGAKSDAPFVWDVKDNVSVGFSAYVQADAYGVADSDASFGTGTVDRPFDTYIRRGIINAFGHIYDWKYLLTYSLTASEVKRGIIWAWLTHDLGPGTVYIGQHWVYAGLEEPVSSSDVLFLERNSMSSSGLTGLRDAGQGLFYQISQEYGAGNNNIFWGVSGYALNNTIADNPPSPGYGINTKLAWAPIVEDRLWYQVGGSLTHEQANGTNALTSGWSNYAGNEQPRQSVARFESESLDDPDLDRATVHFVGSFGSLFLLSEYGLTRFRQDGRDSEDVQAMSFEAGYWLTGESTPFNRVGATYSTPEPIHQGGAVQIAAGYDQLKNLDIDSQGAGAQSCSPSATSTSFDSAAISRCVIDQYRVAVNYWPNPRVRFTGQLTKAVADLGGAGEDDPVVAEVRAQWKF